MPFQSRSQVRAFFAKEKAGELPAGTPERWAKETPDIKALPEKKSYGRSERRKPAAPKRKRYYGQRD